MDFVEVNGPQLMVEVSIDEENMRAYSFQLYSDSESILSHWQMSSPYISDVMRHSTVQRLDIYGDVDNAVRDGVRGLSEDGATVTVTPHLYGFTRLRDGE